MSLVFEHYARLLVDVGVKSSKGMQKYWLNPLRLAKGYMPLLPFIRLHIFTVSVSCMALLACSQSPNETPANATMQSNSIGSVNSAQANLPALTVLDVAYVDSGVLAPLTVKANEAVVSVSWQQVAGPTTTIIDAKSANSWVLMPFTTSSMQQDLAFQVSVELASGNQLSAIQYLVLMPISPQVTVADRWINSQDAVVNVTANFQHAVFGDGVGSASSSSSGAGQLPPDPNNPPNGQVVTLPITWRTDGAIVSQLITNPPEVISFDANRIAQLGLPLSFEPVPVASDEPSEVITLQFDILLPTGERSLVSIFVKQRINEASSSFSESVSSTLIESSSSSDGGIIVSSTALISSSSIAQSSSSVSNSVSSSNIASVSSAFAESSNDSSSLLSSSSVSSGPSERDLAVAAICADSWQGLASLPVAHANYQTQSPYFNHEPFIDPVFVQHIEQSQTREAGNSALVAAMEMLKTQPTGVWLDNAAGLCESVNGKPSLVEYLNLAEARSQLLTLVLYDIPARDCVRQERPGEFEASEFGLADYQHFVDRISALAAVYSNVPIAMVVEPTAFATTVSNGGVTRTNCFEARQLQLHEQALAFALKRLAGNANVFSYLDYGDPSWPGSFSGDQALVDLLERTKLSDGSLAVEGISLNVGSYVPLDEPFMLAQSNASEPFTLPKGVQSINAHRDYLNSTLMEKLGVALPILIDTGRNGWGGELRPVDDTVGQGGRIDRRVKRESWCNTLNAGLGVEFDSGVQESLMWISPPGYSNGNSVSDCKENYNETRHSPMLGAPPAGEWFHNYFVSLINNAYPPLLAETAPAISQALAINVIAKQIPVQSASQVEMILSLPENVTFTGLSLRFAGEFVAPPDGWLGQNSVSFTLDNIPLTYFHDVLQIAAHGSDGQHYKQQAAVFDSPDFDGKPIIDVALGGRGFFPVFYQLYQSDLAEYSFTNNGFEGNDFLWVSSYAPTVHGGSGNDYIQVEQGFGDDGDDILAVWGAASGGDGNDIFYLWDKNVVVEDTPGGLDKVYWLGRNFNSTDFGASIDIQSDGDNLIMIENLGGGDKQATLTVKGFLANPPHIDEIHYSDGQLLTPDMAREILGINAP